jgi:hypothetical protein
MTTESLFRERINETLRTCIRGSGLPINKAGNVILEELRAAMEYLNDSSSYSVERRITFVDHQDIRIYGYDCECNVSFQTCRDSVDRCCERCEHSTTWGWINDI